MLCSKALIAHDAVAAFGIISNLIFDSGKYGPFLARDLLYNTLGDLIIVKTGGKSSRAALSENLKTPQDTLCYAFDMATKSLPRYQEQPAT